MDKIVGYEEIHRDNYIPLCCAYTYALKQLESDKQLQNEFVEWFYSGSYVPVREGEECKHYMN